jgi:hypothetical protein
MSYRDIIIHGIYITYLMGLLYIEVIYIQNMRVSIYTNKSIETFLICSRNMSKVKICLVIV